jgi:cardiolipin synthase
VHVLTYPNLLTSLRIVFVPIFVLFVVQGRYLEALTIFVAAGLTDLLDGVLARRLHQKTPLGSILDPAADKLLVTSALVTLSVRSLPLAVHIPLWLTATSILRDVLIASVVLVLYLSAGQSSFPPSTLGKATTAAFLITIALALLGNVTGAKVVFFREVVYSTWGLTVASGLHYLFRTAAVVRSWGKAGEGLGAQGGQDSGGTSRLSR